MSGIQYHENLTRSESLSYFYFLLNGYVHNTYLTCIVFAKHQRLLSCDFRYVFKYELNLPSSPWVVGRRAHNFRAFKMSSASYKSVSLVPVIFWTVCNLPPTFFFLFIFKEQANTKMC